MTDFAEPLEQAGRTEILWRGRKLAYFAGCDYYRLSAAPAILRAIRTALRSVGLNVAASRKTTGNHPLYEALEAEAARFFGAEMAVLTSNGYLTNIVAAQGLKGQFTTVFIDERAHPSLHDAAKFLECETLVFPHRHPDALAHLRPKRTKGAALLTDGLFAQSGAFAPLRRYREIMGPGALLWIDDSHAAGVVGATGKGTIEAAGLDRKGVLQTVTFSKAFGVYGGAVLGARELIGSIPEKSHAVVGNTPLPLPLAAGALASLKWVRAHPKLRLKLLHNIELFWTHAVRPAPERLAPIVSFVTPDARKTKKLRERLLARGVYPSHIKYPGGPAEGYFRFAISSGHSPRQVRALAEAIRDSDAEALG